mmetsp:Transcript_53620/g.83519  ORF Transcript_53620/g.83519 Transcript_53620/m.83519 type:complete len:327 (+) Transcript_53620:37-1017(+)
MLVKTHMTSSVMTIALLMVLASVSHVSASSDSPNPTNQVGQVPTVKIAPGIQMPMLAFGSARTSFKTCSVQDGVEQWLRLGGRHIDTADDYGTQLDVGRAIKASGISRDEVFITTKIPGPIGKANVTNKILDTALPQLGVDYIDLVLIHFPCPASLFTGCGKEYANERRDTYEGLAELRKQGRIRAVGVSNYGVDQVEEIFHAFHEYPAVNQVQYHLAYHNDTLLRKMKDVGTVLEAWASLGGPTVHGKTPTIPLSDPRLGKIAKKYNASSAQVIFRWETQKGVVPVTATCDQAHATGDLNSFFFKLSDEDIATLDAMKPAQAIIV